MKLEIISPEAVLLQSEVKSVAVPGVNGEFQILDNHAPIVSILQEGLIKIDGNITINENVKKKFSKNDEGRWTLFINSGTLEMNNNKVIILAD
ncbi:MAG: F0F1 ATP synthase subunit epsilon [Flavobacteriaceae bacterium]|nr:F0F1 ATP synthase subunit epsilon [Flavobacteriaceae bacterium]